MTCNFYSLKCFYTGNILVESIFYFYFDRLKQIIKKKLANNMNRTHCATQPSRYTIEREVFNNASKEM